MAKNYGVTLRTLRFYEDKGLISPKRDGSTRLYTRRDRARLKLILLGRKVGFSLRDVKQIMDLYDPKGANTKQLRLTLDKSEKQLARLQKQRAAIDEAIDELSDTMSIVRKMLAERTLPSAPRAEPPITTERMGPSARPLRALPSRMALVARRIDLGASRTSAAERAEAPRAVAVFTAAAAMLNACQKIASCASACRTDHKSSISKKARRNIDVCVNVNILG